MRPLLLLPLALAACATGTSALNTALTGEIGSRYLAGASTTLFSTTTDFTGPTSGCGPTTQGSLSTDGKTFAFAPSDSTTILRGTVQGTTLTGATTPPGLSFTATIDGATITGSLTRPACTAKVTLTRR